MFEIPILFDRWDSDGAVPVSVPFGCGFVTAALRVPSERSLSVMRWIGPEAKARIEIVSAVSDIPGRGRLVDVPR